MYLFIIYNLVVLLVGFAKKDKGLKLVGGIGIAIGVISYVMLFVGFGLSDM